MAGLSPPPRRLRSKETSLTPSPLLLTPQRLTPRLPPIVGQRCIAKSPLPPPPSPAPWSWYHRHCQHSPTTHQVPCSRLSQNSNKNSRTQKRSDELDIKMFLVANPAFLAEYVCGEVPARQLEDWLRLKRMADETSPETGSDVMTSCASSNTVPDVIMRFIRCVAWDKCVSDFKENLIMHVGVIQDEKNLARRRACVPSVRCFTPSQLYLIKSAALDEKQQNIISIIENLVTKVFPDAATELYLCLQNDIYVITQTGLVHTSEHHAGIAKRVIHETEPMFFCKHDLPRNWSLPKHIIHLLHKNYYVAFVPFKFEFGTIVLEVWSSAVYTVQEKALTKILPTLVGLILPYHSQYHSLLQESKMSDFLLQVAQAVFEDMLSLDQLIKKILEVAQHLVSADRASLFLVDHRNMELVSTVFDLRYETDQDSDFSKKEIRMPIDKGIAGHVATSGGTMNIPDAYLDQRFNKAVDEATGYRTISILCMPIKVRGKILAVVQMVNKRDKEAFGADDESAFQVFSTFFGLALHHAKLYDKIKRKEQKYKVALEVLGYHNKCSEEDVEAILRERKKTETINYNDFTLNPFEVNEVEKCKGILNMFEDLFDITKFDIKVLTRFVLTVKKNYRKVPYHNFDHGWAVANSMYVMLKHDTETRFSCNNRLALFVASLCHDLDHRGYTNKFMSEIASPLAAIYTTSTLEHHHFNMTVTILQQDGHNIFYQMSSEEYKVILDSIRQCILATDLAAFFPNLKKINKLLLETSQFDWNDESHRVLGQSFCMTGADLSASAKPFKSQLRTVEIIFDEFYAQGDLERQAGLSPVAMMDRRRQDQLPSCQVGFLSQICLPCYKILAALFPNTKPMMDMVIENLEVWKSKAKEIEKTKEE